MTVHDPEVCSCGECRRNHILALLEVYELKKRIPVIEITKVKGIGEMPPFLGVIHRHFEKAIPATCGTSANLVAPLEMLEFLIPAALANAIESVEVVYSKGT